MKAVKIFLTRIDMAAMLIALVGVCLFFGVIIVRAVIDFAGLVSSYWTNSEHRWLVIILGLAVIWIAARWKQISHN